VSEALAIFALVLLGMVMGWWLRGLYEDDTP